MQLNCDTSNTMLVAASPPKASLKYQSDVPRVDANGQVLSEVTVVMFADDDAEKVRIRSAAMAEGITARAQLRVTGLRVATWSNDGRTGLSYIADSVEPYTAPRRGTGSEAA